MPVYFRPVATRAPLATLNAGSHEAAKPGPRGVWTSICFVSMNYATEPRAPTAEGGGGELKARSAVGDTSIEPGSRDVSDRTAIGLPGGAPVASAGRVPRIGRTPGLAHSGGYLAMSPRRKPFHGFHE